MADARQLIGPLRAALTPVPAVPQNGVCTICHSSTASGYRECLACREAAHFDPPGILPITLSVHGGLIHQHLRNYKDSRSASVRERTTLRLAGLLALFMSYHDSCIGAWDYAVSIPSAHRRAVDPIVARIPLFHHRYRRVLVARHDPANRTVDPAQFEVIGDVSGQRILLLDDTLTTGAKLFSATAALRAAGASIAGPVVIGRHIRQDWEPSADLLSWLKDREWSEERCVRCAGEHRTGTLF